MTKYLLLLVFFMLAGFGIWFWQLSGPQKLDFADRHYWGKSEQAGSVQAGIAYGDDQRQQLDIYRPAGTGAHPVLLFYHGGGWHDGEREGYAFLGRAFASRGFVTVIADYRKYPQVRFPAFVEDAAAALRWTRANIGSHGGRPDSIFLMGHSAGAHLAMMVALDPRWLQKHGLSATDIAGVIGLAGPYDFLPFEKGGSADRALGDWPRPPETQPIHFASGKAPPLLLLHGASDDIVGAHNYRNLEKAIRQAGGKVSSRLYPSVDHYDIIMAVARPFRNRAPVISDSISFMTSAGDQVRSTVASGAR